MSFRTFSSRVLPIASLLLVVLFKFENCAQSPQMLGGATTPTSGTVGLVDNYNQTPLQFVANPQLVSASASSSVKVQGLCVGGVEHQTIVYQVIDMKTTPKLVLEGQVECQYGGFELPVENLVFSNCDDQYEVHAARANDPSLSTVTTLKLDCVSTNVQSNSTAN